MTTRELIRIADREGIDIPADLERVFIIRELLENESAESLEEPVEQRHKHVPVPLPKQYNITCLEILIRDPLWVFAFWEIKQQDKEYFEKAPDFCGYCLRVNSLNDASRTFTVSVGSGDEAWYLGFPPTGGSYRVELCAILAENGASDGQAYKALAVSKPFSMPRLLDLSGGEENLNNPLVRLSGAEYFSVIRNTDRLSRRYLAS